MPHLNLDLGLSRNRRSIILRELAWLRKDPRDESRPSKRSGGGNRRRKISQDGSKRRGGKGGGDLEIRTRTVLGPTLVRSREKRRREMEIWKFESSDEFESWNFHRVERAEREKERERKEKEISEICRQIRTLKLPFDRAKKERVKIKKRDGNLEIRILKFPSRWSGVRERDGEREEKEIYRQIRTLKLPSDRAKKERMEIWKFIRK